VLGACEAGACAPAAAPGRASLRRPGRAKCGASGHSPLTPAALAPRRADGGRGNLSRLCVTCNPSPDLVIPVVSPPENCE